MCEAFDKTKVLEAIEEIDKKKITAKDFYEKLAQAGVALGIVFFKKNRIFYLGRNGDFYLEEW